MRTLAGRENRLLFTVGQVKFPMLTETLRCVSVYWSDLPIMTRKGYVYPTDERATDAAEMAADPWKMARETALIESMLCFDWKLCLDFGVGVGRHLATVSRTAAPHVVGQRIIAYDPDVARLEQAQKREYSISIDFLSGTLDDLARKIEPASLDAIICCQVLGHLSVASFRQSMKFFFDKLSGGGILLLCVPFCAHGYRSDFFHVVDVVNVGHGNVQARREVTEAEFSRQASQPIKGKLPVRAFKIGSPRLLDRDACLPIPCSLPQAIAEAANFKLISAMVYSVHVWSDAHCPAIGDLLIKLER